MADIPAPEPPRAAGAARRLLMARAGAALFVGEGLLALTAHLAQGSTSRSTPVVAAVALAACGLAGIVYFGRERLSRAGSHAVAAAGAVLIGVVVFVERPSFGLLYVWLAFFVAAFFRRRAVVLHVAWMIACFGVAVFFGDPLGQPFGSWVLLAGTLAGATAFISVVRSYLTSLAERERQSRAVLDTVFGSAPVGMALFDRELRYLRVNKTFAGWSGLGAEAHVGLRIDDVHPGIGAQVEPAMRRTLETGEAVVGVEADGRGRRFRSSRFPIRDGRGEIAMVAAILDDVTELTQMRERLQEALDSERTLRASLAERNDELAHRVATDSLTGVASRAAFAERAAADLAHAAGRGRAVAVVCLDLDGFKRVNDTWGHAAGDTLLQIVAKRLRGVGREQDLVARLGGDEFVLLLGDLEPGGARELAGVVATRITDALRSPIALMQGTARVSASVGLSVYPADAHDVETLVAAADADMYRRKHGLRRAG